MADKKEDVKKTLLYSDGGDKDGPKEDQEKKEETAEGDGIRDDVSAGEETLITITDAAREAFINITKQEGVSAESVLRLGVIGGGCAGFNYDMYFDEDITDRDRIMVSNGVNLVVDEMSLMYLAGTVVGHATSLKGSGFTFDNPNAKSTCGCAMSFAV